MIEEGYDLSLRDSGGTVEFFWGKDEGNDRVLGLGLDCVGVRMGRGHGVFWGGTGVCCWCRRRVDAFCVMVGDWLMVV